jgi:predicted acetyltransferase
MVARTHEDFTLKLDDYISSGAHLLLVQNANSTVEGYCIYFINEDKILAEEMIFTSEAALKVLIRYLNSEYNGLRTDIKLPPDTDTSKLTDDFAGSTAALIEQNASGVSDLECFIKALKFSRTAPAKLLKEFVVQVKDDFNVNNTGTFDLTGKRRKSTPVLQIDIGNFVRFLYGYVSASDLTVAADVNVRSLADKTDKALGRPVCRIIDEY